MKERGLGTKDNERKIEQKGDPCNPLHCHTSVYSCLVHGLGHIIQLLQPKNKLAFIGSYVQPRNKQTILRKSR